MSRWSAWIRSGQHSRRISAVAAIFSLLVSQTVAAQSTADASETSRFFDSDWLDSYARELARQPFQSGELAADNPLRQLNYDDYRRILFRPDAAIWRGTNSPFQLQLFHPGFLATSPVSLHLVNAGQAQPLAFTPTVFNYHEDLGDIDTYAAGGYAGFRVHHPINSGERFEEFLVFLGASYFRGVGKNQFYGLSARGLAVNTVGPGGEEFPRFSEFWIETPSLDAADLQIHALLD
ncbi:MAG TPA: glucan biosynthesis protein D, partial [Gammaproteobacteria bacterium]|nr:glucan biosynthesis protein D [Gammaproteobacteria bacterium]